MIKNFVGFPKTTIRNMCVFPTNMNKSRSFSKRTLFRLKSYGESCSKGEKGDIGFVD